MRVSTLDYADRVIEQYFSDHSLSGLLAKCVEDKASEQPIWSELTILTHRWLGGTETDQAEHVAALVELLILSLDIVDDLQDQDNPSKFWMKQPPEEVLNFILAFIFSIQAELNVFSTQHSNLMIQPNYHFNWNELVIRSIQGQQDDLRNEVTTEQDYIEMITKKSGSLLYLSMYAGTFSIALDEEQLLNLRNIGESLGIHAQLQNDVRDLVRFDVKNDVMNKKKTLPILFLLEEGSFARSDLVQYYLGKIKWDDLFVNKEKFQEWIHSTGCVEYTGVIQSMYIQHATSLMDLFDGDPQAKQELLGFFLR